MATRDNIPPMNSAASHRADPLVSVIVPMFDTEQYVGECLASILGQSYSRLDVVVVDDASTDGSVQVVEAVAAVDDRVRLVRRPVNQGLGAARNEGLRHARGDFVTFADSDDRVAAGAYRRMAGSLVASGSDLVVGSMARVPEIGIDEPPVIPAWIVPLHRRGRSSTSIGEVPELLRNVFAWTKMFSRDFWERSGLAFPEGVAYEDHESTAGAYLAARSLDVLPDVVYHWRLRSGGRSITQRKHEIDNLRDFARAKVAAHRVVLDRAPAHVATAWRATLLDDFRPYLDQVPTADDDYWSVLRDTARRLLVLTDDQALARVGVRTRVLTSLVAQGRRAEATEVLRHLAAEPHGRRPALLAAGAGDDLGLTLSGAVPTGLLRLAATDRRLVVTLRSVQVDGDRMTVRAVVQVLGVADRGDEPRVSLVLQEQRGPGHEVVVALASRRRVEGAQVRRPRGSWPLIDVCGELLLGGAPTRGDGAGSTWSVDVRVDTTVGSVTSPMARLGPGCDLSAGAEDLRGAVTWVPGSGLHVRRTA